MGDRLHCKRGAQTVTSDGIEPPLSDLESEVLPLHHEAVAANWLLTVAGAPFVRLTAAAAARFACFVV